MCPMEWHQRKLAFNLKRITLRRKFQNSINAITMHNTKTEWTSRLKLSLKCFMLGIIQLDGSALNLSYKRGPHNSAQARHLTQSHRHIL